MVNPHRYGESAMVNHAMVNPVSKHVLTYAAQESRDGIYVPSVRRDRAHAGGEAGRI